MAVMSFAHLKNKNSPMKEKAPPVAPSTPVQPVRKAAGGVMSFAHLKGKKKPAVAREVKQPVTEAKIFRIPAVMPTARLAATNYCRGCPRFLPASEWEKGVGNPYGRCLRSGEIDSDIHLEKIKQEMSKAGRAPRSIQYMLATVRQVFINHAMANGLYHGNNPAAGKSVKRPSIGNRRTRFLKEDESDALLSGLAKRSTDTHDMALFSLHSGAKGPGRSFHSPGVM